MVKIISVLSFIEFSLHNSQYQNLLQWLSQWKSALKLLSVPLILSETVISLFVPDFFVFSDSDLV